MAKTCDDCARPFDTNRRNAKYCPVCRAYRNAIFIANRTKRCMACDVDFAPLDTKAIVCGHCDPNSRASDAAGECAFCHQESDKLLHEEIAVCRPCATDTRNRELFIKALAKKRKHVSAGSGNVATAQ